MRKLLVLALFSVIGFIVYAGMDTPTTGYHRAAQGPLLIKVVHNRGVASTSCAGYNWGYTAGEVGVFMEDPGCYSNDCYFGRCSDCRDLNGNCCDCSCHVIGQSPAVSPYQRATPPWEGPQCSYRAPCYSGARSAGITSLGEWTTDAECSVPVSGRARGHDEQ